MTEQCMFETNLQSSQYTEGSDLSTVQSDPLKKTCLLLKDRSKNIRMQYVHLPYGIEIQNDSPIFFSCLLYLYDLYQLL